ncbi:Gx transporter family protein [Caloranaerobacter azorensis]|uniref:Gx transporter family protein n=1 Tax=Caloranaerobacter azorensis TaxID=116090 RepID=A0A6P1YCR6_9FIRM|nr:Gx transporter family protein [Caloranaerobacter azorensis]QIB26598.1 Gx transporter family protein [Caloranaerobacter azorensis]
MNNIKKLIFLSLLVSLGLAISILESFIPLPFIAPGAKLGLANIVILSTLIIFGYKEALIVVILRSITFSLATGSVTSLFYSLTGSLLSLLAMYFVYRFLSKMFSVIGVSIIGAIFHNIGQISVASIMMENVKIFSYLPVMNLVSLFTGYFVGLSTLYTTKHLKKIFNL